MAVVVAGGVAGCGGGSGDADRLERARDLVADPDGFRTAEAASLTLARAAGLLLEDARRCHDDEGGTDRCRARASAAGLTEVLAVHVLRCTAPGRFEARRALTDYLDGIAEGDEQDAAGGGLPAVPRLPDC